MATKNVKEAEDNSLGAFVYQGKPLSEWEKLLKKEYNFTLDQVFALARSGADLDKILHVGLDEADGFDNPVFKDEEFFSFNEDDDAERYFRRSLIDNGLNKRLEDLEFSMPKSKYLVKICYDNGPKVGKGSYATVWFGDSEDAVKKQIKSHIKPTEQIMSIEKLSKNGKLDEVSDEEAALDESARQPEDVVTVEDFIELLRRDTKLDDKLMFRVNKASAMLFNVNSHAGTAVVDIIPAKDSRRLDEDIVLDLNGMTDDFLTMGDLVRLGKKAWPNNKTGWIIDNIAAVVDGKVVDFKDVKYVRPEGYPSNGTFFLIDGKPASYDAVKTEIGVMLSESASATPEKWQTAADWFNANGFPIEDDEDRLEQFAPQTSQFLFKVGCSPTRKDEVVPFEDAWRLYQSMSNKNLNEDSKYSRFKFLKSMLRQAPLDRHEFDELIELAKTFDKKMAKYLEDNRDICCLDESCKLNEAYGDPITVDSLRRAADGKYDVKDNWKFGQIIGLVNGKPVGFVDVACIKVGNMDDGAFFLMDGTDASRKELDRQHKLAWDSAHNKGQMTEGQSWRRGGYGGTGRSWKSLGGRGPRGAEIGWYAVEELDPKARGKMLGWRCGPSNFPFEDLLYPDRKYKVGTMVMRNKYLKAGSMSGEKYIAIPSYFSAIKDNDKEALALLDALNIPLDLTFGMDPNDDYSVTYTLKN